MFSRRWNAIDSPYATNFFPVYSVPCCSRTRREPSKRIGQVQVLWDTDRNANLAALSLCVNHAFSWLCHLECRLWSLGFEAYGLKLYQSKKNVGPPLVQENWTTCIFWSWCRGLCCGWVLSPSTPFHWYCDFPIFVQPFTYTHILCNNKFCQNKQQILAFTIRLVWSSWLARKRWVRVPRVKTHNSHGGPGNDFCDRDPVGGCKWLPTRPKVIYQS